MNAANVAETLLTIIAAMPADCTEYLTDLAADQRLRGVHFAKIERAAVTLAAHGKIVFVGAMAGKI